MKRFSLLALLGPLTLLEGCIGGYPPWAEVAAPFRKTPAQLEEGIRVETQGYTPEGETMKGDLASFKPHAVKMVRGKCYVVVLRLDPGADFSDAAKKGVVMLYKGVDTGVPLKRGATLGMPGILGPGGVAHAGCAQSDTDTTFELHANALGFAQRSQPYDLGRGGYTLEVFTKQLSDAELAKRKQDELNAALRADRQLGVRILLNNQCCQEKKLECIAEGTPRAQCDSENEACRTHACR